MKILAVALATLAIACGPKGVPIPDTSPMDSIEPTRVIRVIGYRGFASACAIRTETGDQYILTDAHFAKESASYSRTLGQMLTGLARSDYLDRQGYFIPTDLSPFRDIAVLSTLRGGLEPVYNLLSTSAPEVGDTLRWYQYEGGDKDYFAPEMESGEVVRILAGHIMVDQVPTNGASGTCVFNQDSKVVGLVAWGIYTTNAVINLTGQWQIP